MSARQHPSSHRAFENLPPKAPTGPRAWRERFENRDREPSPVPAWSEIEQRSDKGDSSAFHAGLRPSHNHNPLTTSSHGQDGHKMPLRFSESTGSKLDLAPQPKPGGAPLVLDNPSKRPYRTPNCFIERKRALPRAPKPKSPKPSPPKPRDSFGMWKTPIEIDSSSSDDEELSGARMQTRDDPGHSGKALVSRPKATTTDAVALEKRAPAATARETIIYKATQPKTTVQKAVVPEETMIEPYMALKAPKKRTASESFTFALPGEALSPRRTVSSSFSSNKIQPTATSLKVAGPQPAEVEAEEDDEDILPPTGLSHDQGRTKIRQNNPWMSPFHLSPIDTWKLSPRLQKELLEICISEGAAYIESDDGEWTPNEAFWSRVATRFNQVSQKKYFRPGAWRFCRDYVYGSVEHRYHDIVYKNVPPPRGGADALAKLQDTWIRSYVLKQRKNSRMKELEEACYPSIRDLVLATLRRLQGEEHTPEQTKTELSRVIGETLSSDKAVEKRQADSFRYAEGERIKAERKAEKAEREKIRGTTTTARDAKRPRLE